MNQSRPKNLNLFTIHFPIPAIVSILHRISGFILFLMIPGMLWTLDYSLTKPGYDTIVGWLDNFPAKFIIWLLLIPFYFHLIAGIRHLLSDIRIGDTLAAGRATSYLTFALTFVLMILTGIWLW